MAKDLMNTIQNKVGNAAGSGVYKYKEEIERLKEELEHQRSLLEDGKGTVLKIEEVILAEPFKSLFPINEEVLSRIERSITFEGFDDSQPLILWEGQNILLDGHTRLQAAKNVGMKVVPVRFVEVTSDSVLYRAIAYQMNRRNITDADIIHAVANLLKLNKTSPLPGQGRTRDKIGNILKVSHTKIQKVMTLIESNQVEILQRIQKGSISINQAHEIFRKSRKKRGSGKEELTVDLQGDTVFIDDVPVLSFMSHEIEKLSSEVAKNIRKVVTKSLRSM